MAQPYSTLQQLIDHLDQASDASPAALHGLWCGRLAGGEPPASEGCWEYTRKLLSAPREVDERLIKAFRALMNFSATSLEDQQLGFTPWLPSDSQPCAQRLQALAEWCRAFVEGLLSVRRDALSSLSGEARELLNDLIDIGEVDSDIGESDQEERELEELTEFVKVAVLHLYLDQLAAAAVATPTPGTTLH